MFDHCGTAMEDWPEYGRMLAGSKPFMNALAERCLPDARERGVGILHHERGSHAVRLREGDDYDDLYLQGQGWMWNFIPYTPVFQLT